MKKTFLILLLSISSSVIFAGNIYVSTTGNDENTGNSPVDALKTIKKAVALSVAGDVINIAEGIYTEAHIAIDKNITLIGANAATTIVQASETKPDGTLFVADKHIFYLANATTATIKLLTIRYGYNSNGGGAIAVPNATQTLIIEECNIVDNYTQYGGGAITSSGNLTVNRCFISRNTAKTNGGAINALGGTAIIKNTVIYNNVAYGTANTNSSGGGACYIGASKVKLYSNTVAYNSCANSANKNFGIRIEGNTGTEFEIYNNIFCNSLSNLWDSGVDINVNYISYIPDGTKNKNNIFMFVNSNVFLNSSTIPVPTTPQTGYPAESQIAFGEVSQGNNGVYYLPIMESSIAKNAADPTTSLTTDILGSTRGSTPDIGAFEYIPNTSTHDVETSMNTNMVFPSPSNGEFTLDLPTNQHGELEVYSLSGQKIFIQSINNGKALVKLPTDIKGIVILRFASDKVVYTQKLQIV